MAARPELSQTGSRRRVLCKGWKSRIPRAAPAAGKRPPVVSAPGGVGLAWRAIGAALILLLPLAALAQSQQRQPPAISIAAKIVALPSARTPLPIAVAAGDGLPRNAYLRIRGLPPNVALTEGHAIAPGVWAIPLSVVSTLAAIVPIGAQGTSEIALDLVSLEGSVLAEAKTTFFIAALEPASAAPAPTVAAPGAAAAKPPEREQALRFYSKGLELLERGDVDAARRFFERAADMGLSQAAMALATTYDPNELTKLKVIGLQGNAATARKWYDRATELGAAEAGDRLRRLGAR
jgi:hypothetical protein